MSTEQYFSVTPQVPARPTRVEFEVAGRTFRLSAAGGVFSADRLDPGTAVLLCKAELPGPGTTGALLDLGCGYGPIACVLATLAPQAIVYAVDVNTRALDLARANAAELGLAARVVVASPDAVPQGGTFAQIWSNPPIHVGKSELHALLDRWLPRLAPGGTAWLVVARNLGADSLAQWLAGRGWQVQRQASKRGFRVLRVAWPARSGQTSTASQQPPWAGSSANGQQPSWPENRATPPGLARRMSDLWGTST